MAWCSWQPQPPRSLRHCTAHAAVPTLIVCSARGWMCVAEQIASIRPPSAAHAHLLLAPLHSFSAAHCSAAHCPFRRPGPVSVAMNRGVAQLSRVDLGYSLLSGASKGVREFVGSPLMKQFQAQHPHVKLVARVNSRGFPHAEATYRPHTRAHTDRPIDGPAD